MSKSVMETAQDKASAAVDTAQDKASAALDVAQDKAAAAAVKGAALAGAAKTVAGAKAAQTVASAKAARAAKASKDWSESAKQSAKEQTKDWSESAKDWSESARGWTEPRMDAARAALVAAANDPRLGEASERVREDIAPRVTAALMTALESSRPSRDEALRRASAAVAALRGETVVEDVSVDTDVDTDSGGGGRGKRILLVLVILGALAAVVKAVLARQAEQDAAAIWQTGEGFSAGSVPAGHDTHPDVTPTSPLAEDAAGAAPDEVVADLSDSGQVVVEADSLDESMAGPLGEGQVDLRDEGTRGKHTRG